jgi:hypothetical protein
MAGVPVAAAFVIKRHARRPYIRLLVKDQYGDPFDFTGAASVNFYMYDALGVVKVSSTGTIETPVTTGVIRYAWGATDTNTAGEYRAEFDVVYTGGEKLTIPVKGNLAIRIYDDLNNG